MESMTVTLVKSLLMGGLDPEPVTFCNQARLQVEGLGHQPSHKTFDLQFVLPAVFWDRSLAGSSSKRPERFIQVKLYSGCSIREKDKNKRKKKMQTQITIHCHFIHTRINRI